MLLKIYHVKYIFELASGLRKPSHGTGPLSQVSQLEDIPVIDISSTDRSTLVRQIHQACARFGFVQIINHGFSKATIDEMVSVVTHEFFGMPMNEKRKLYSGDPKKTPRLSTSFNVKEEEVNNWRDYRRLNCYPIDKYVHKWPSNPFIDISSTYRPQLIQQTHSYYTRFDKASITMEALPNDLEERILLNLPPTELGTYSRVSMRCRNVIQSKEFIKEYIGRSTTEPRLLLVETTMKPEVLFHSMYQQANPLLSGKEKVRIPHSPGPQLHIDHPVRGLVCLSYETKVVITNPGAKEIVCLPENETGKQGETKCFLGYDEDTDVYKVLCVPVPVLSTREEAREYQVLTVGSGGESWRGIECKHHHSLVTNGICKGGVVYFVALSECRQIVRVMSFNVNSEIFTVTELPKGAEIHESFSFVNYNGTMALVDELSGTRVEPNGTGVLEMWIMNELERTWETCGIELPCWEETVGSTKYFFKGTIGTGELVFAPIHWFHGHFSVLYYDPVTHKYRVFPIDGVGTDYMYKVRTFLDHVDSPLLI